MAGQLRFCGHNIIIACWITPFGCLAFFHAEVLFSLSFLLCKITFLPFFSKLTTFRLFMEFWDKQTSGSWFNLYYALFIALYIRCLVTTWIDIPTGLCGKEEGVGDAFKNMNAELWFYKFVPQARGQWQNLTVNVQAYCKGGLDRTGLCKHGLDWICKTWVERLTGLNGKCRTLQFSQEREGSIPG